MPLSPARDDDLDDIAALVNRAYRGGEGWTHEGDYLDGQRTSPAALRADLAHQPNARLLMLRDAAEGLLLGVVWLEPAADGAWYLGMLTVRPDVQGGQFGRRMLEEAEAWARRGGATRMRMTVVNVRESLIAWYARRGYHPTGEIEPFPYAEQRFGVPRRDDLAFVVLEKALDARS